MPKDLPNAAFVLAMYQAVTPQPHEELDVLKRDWGAWLPTVGGWTPASTDPGAAADFAGPYACVSTSHSWTIIYVDYRDRRLRRARPHAFHPAEPAP